MPLSVAAPAPSELERAGSHGGAPSTSGTVSRASARAQRRIQASAARRRTTSEVLLLTSKAFPSDQYQELLTFLKGLHLPPDATSLFTTVRNEQFANKKALLSAHTKEVDEVLGRYGGDWALLSLCAEELGLGTTAASPPGRKSTAQGNSPTQQGALVQRNGSVLTAGQFSGADESTALHALSQKWAERQPRTDGVARRPGGGFTLSVEALGVPVFVCDAAGVVVEWNACLAALTGAEPSECEGRPLLEMVAEEQREMVSKLFASPVESEAVLRIGCADGSQLSISFALSHFDPAAPAATPAAAAPAAAAEGGGGKDGAPARGADTNLGKDQRRGVLGVGKDVSSLATAVAAATQEVHDLKRLIDGANAPIFGINAANLITEWNRKATAITGRSKWEVVGRRLEEFINPEDRDSVVEVLENALKGKETANFGFPLYTKAGDRVEILLNASTRRDANGNICGVISVGQDITELMRGKKELASVANDLRMLIESANAPIFGVDNAGRLTEWNSKATAITGYSQEEMLGRNLVEAEIILPEFKASVRQVISNAMSGINTENFELPLYSRHGQRVELLLNATTRHSASDAVVGVVMVGQDITEKKDMEKAQIAAAKARAASDAKGKFLASMSHEMRTPLNGVLGMLQLAMELELPPRALQFCQNAMMSAQHLMNLVNDILDISKIEAGKLELEQRVFHLPDVLRAAVEIVQVNAVHKNLSIELEISPDLPEFIVGDQQRLRQVLLNLLFNAVKFTPQGRIVVTAAVQQEFANHLRIYFSVEDTGIGIRQEDMAKLFGLFSKIRDKRVENPLGVGLGLAICKQLVELMRGQIHVTSVYGQGTKFFFTAIHGRSNDKEAAAAMKERDLAHKKVQGGAEVQERDTGRVLVVEDNEFNMEVVRCMLENEGNLVSLATNGQEACEAYQAAVERSEPFEVIFMDCNMPVLDGYEATKKIRKMQAEREKAPSAKGGASYVPVVALTAYAMPGDKEKCLNAGMDDYITKPVNKDVLLSTLGKHLKEGRRRAAEAKQAQGDKALGAQGGAAHRPAGHRRETSAGGRGTVTGRRMAEAKEGAAHERGEKAKEDGGPDDERAQAFVEESQPLNREAARSNFTNFGGPGGDELLCRMEDEFVAKSAALVGRMTVAAAQANLSELRSELETLQDFAHMLRAQRLTRALAELARAVEELQEKPKWQPSDIASQLTAVDRAAQLVRSYILKAHKAGQGAAEGGGGAAAGQGGRAQQDGKARPAEELREVAGAASKAAAPSAAAATVATDGLRSSGAERGGGAGGGSVSGGSVFSGGAEVASARVGARGQAAERSSKPGVIVDASPGRQPQEAKPQEGAKVADKAQGGGGGGGGAAAGGGGGGSRLPESLLHQKALSGPISGFVQRGELMLERMRAHLEAGNLKGVRREALRMKATAAQLENRRLIRLSDRLAAQAEQSDPKQVAATLSQVQQRLNHILNYSVRGMLVHNTLTELAEDLRLAAAAEEPQTACLQLQKAADEFRQLSEYLSIKKPPEKAALASAEREGAADAAEGRAEAEAEEAAASSEGPNQASSHEELQCKTTVAMCVLTGQGMLEAMQRAVQQSHSLHHSAACRLVADTFLEVVDDLGSAAMSDEMVEVQRKVDRVNSRFFHVSDLIARNAMAAADNTDSAAAAAQSLNPAPQSVPPSVSRERGGGAQPELGRRLETLEEPEEKRPAIDRRVALEQFGGDEGFFRRMCAKFITSGGGVVSRISRLAATEDGELDYAEVRREAHSMKGASSTIGAMQLSQAALELQLTAERLAAPEAVRSQAALVKRHFELVQEELGLSAADVEAERAKAAAADKRPSAGSFNNGHASTGSEYRDRKRAAGARTAGRRVQTPTATKYHVATRYNR